MIQVFINYVKSRHFEKRHGWGKPWVKWLWLDALCFAVVTTATLYSPWFHAWCRQLNKLFRERTDYPGEYVTDTGFDYWIEQYRSGSTPEDAYFDEIANWDCD